MIEFTVGLIVVLVLFAGFLQIAQLGHRRNISMAEARGEAGAKATMYNGYLSEMPGPEFIREWRPGPDGHKHSVDDEFTPGFASEVDDGIIRYAKPAELGAWAPNNQLSALSGSPIVPSVGLVHGVADPVELPLVPIVRKLIYDADTIRVEADAWMVWTSGIE
jgi:hypothetical protein